MSEQWRPVPGYEGYYEVSDAGNARSLDRWTRRGRPPGMGWLVGKALKCTPNPDGYPVIALYGPSGHRHVRTLHTVVAETFLGPRPAGLEVRHLNGIKTDARVSNLAYGTKVENMQDRLVLGENPHHRKTHCKNGHPFSGNNLYLTPSARGGTGIWRQCRTCKRAADVRRRAARGEQVA